MKISIIDILHKIFGIKEYIKRNIILSKIAKKGINIMLDTRNIDISYPENLYLGDFVNIGHSFFLSAYKSKVLIGNNVTLNKNVIIYSVESNITIGDNTYINHHSELIGKMGSIKIGKDVLIGMDVLITTYNHGFESVKIPIIKQKGSGESIDIEDNVWIGAKAIILPGVKIQKGSVVGAGSVVTKNVDAFSIVAGNPAKLIRKRM